MLEAEKGKVYAEAEKRILEERYSELSAKQHATVERLREAEVLIQLLEKEARSSKNEAEQAEKSMKLEMMQLNENLAALHLKDEAARERAQELEEHKATLETKVASLLAEVEKVEKERVDEVASLEHQLSETRRQKQTAEEELKGLWKEMGETRKR